MASGTAHAQHSHLFPGALIRVAAPLGAELTVRFGDGSSATAELLDPAGHDGEALRVDGYVTAAGTALPEAVWAIAARTETDGVVELRLGARLTPR